MSVFVSFPHTIQRVYWCIS